MGPWFKESIVVLGSIFCEFVISWFFFLIQRSITEFLFHCLQKYCQIVFLCFFMIFYFLFYLVRNHARNVFECLFSILSFLQLFLSILLRSPVNCFYVFRSLIWLFRKSFLSYWHDLQQKWGSVWFEMLFDGVVWISCSWCCL